MTEETYMVFRVYRDNYKKDIIETGLTRDEACTMVQSFPSKEDSMVVFNEE